jgi:hypothetical protein
LELGGVRPDKEATGGRDKHLNRRRAGRMGSFKEVAPRGLTSFHSFIDFLVDHLFKAFMIRTVDRNFNVSINMLFYLAVDLHIFDFTKARTRND